MREETGRSAGIADDNRLEKDYLISVENCDTAPYSLRAPALLSARSGGGSSAMPPSCLAINFGRRALVVAFRMALPRRVAVCQGRIRYLVALNMVEPIKRQDPMDKVTAPYTASCRA